MRLRKIIPIRSVLWLLFILLWPSLLQAQDSAEIALTEAERDWLAANPRILFGSDSQWRPFVWRESDGSHAGIEADLIRRINALTGANIQLLLGDWADMVARAEQAELHGLAASASHPERAERFLFSASLYSTHKFIFTRDGSPFRSMSDLSGRRVGVLRRNLSDLKLLDAWPDIIRVEIDSPLELAVALQNAKLDAVISSANLQWIATENMLPDVHLAFPVPGSRIDLRYSILKEHAPLLGIIDKGLKAIEPVEMMKILRKWRAEPSPTLELSADERAYLDARTFRRALATAWTPFDFANADGAPTGVAEDYWALIRDKLDLRETSAERKPFSAILSAMERGEIDLYAATTQTADRERYALFSDPYEHYPIAVAGGANAGLFAGTATLAGRRVAVGRDYSAYHLLKAQSPGIDFVLVDNTRAALEAVAERKADVAVDILPVLHQQIEGFPPGQVKLIGVTDLEFPLQVMISRQQAPLLPLINRAIAAITPAERGAIHNKWLLRQVVTAPDYSLLWQVLMVALLILLTILYWNHRLHREVGRRKRAETELLQAKEIADRASRAKGDFLANMSHEIRTPLNAVIGLTRLSTETKPGPLLREYLDKIDLSARTLLALINDILDLSRIEANKLQPRQEPLELDDVLARVRVMVEQQAADKGLVLRIDGPTEPIGMLLGDSLRLTQVLLNLVGNAIKFTAQGRVTLAVWVDDANAREIQLGFTVTDTGIGIPEDQRADLFEAFTQVDTSSTRSHGGSGLGLAISARLVALMGGRLEVESIAGKGSCFWFSLVFPRATLGLVAETGANAEVAVAAGAESGAEVEAEAAAVEGADAATKVVPTPPTAAPPAQTAALRGARILVAEDDPISQLLARELLSRHGALVSLVTTGTEAVAAATAGDFDLLLMDVRMPEMDGLTACRQIRALPNGKLPIIALTANALAGERERCLAAGMDGYLTKPLEPESLYAELSRWLRLPAAAHEVSQPESVIARRDIPQPVSVIAGRDITQPVSVIASRPIDLSGFDANKVRRWLDEAPDIWRTMAQRLVAEYPETASAIAGALDADDRARAGDLLHRLRGAAGALGADDLSAAAEQLELALASDEPVDADLRVRFFASAEVSNAALTELKILD